MDRSEVTNAEFAKFVEATGYRTSAERSSIGLGVGGLSEFMAGGALVFDPVQGEGGEVRSLWKWRRGAEWRFPRGPGSGIERRQDHPVVQVSWEDAKAYARWRGRRLPEVREWALAWRWVRGVGGDAGANLWQGKFPGDNLLADGFRETAPAGYFQRDASRLTDLDGNVAEWCVRVEGEGAKSVSCGTSYLSPEVLGEVSIVSVELEEGTARPDLGFRCVLDAPAPEVESE
jgi:formylglycine-generating enzyme required for sulfatase activity